MGKIERVWGAGPRAGRRGRGQPLFCACRRSERNQVTPESHRLAFIVERDGKSAARQWAERTLGIYREAVQNPRSHASRADYRGMFLASIREMENWLRADCE